MANRLIQARMADVLELGKLPRTVFSLLLSVSMVVALCVLIMKPAPRPGPFNPIPGMNLSAQIDLWGENCLEPFKQCGGHDWHGTTCCQVGCACKPSGQYFSSCQPIQGQGACNAELAKGHAHDVLVKSVPDQEAAINAIKAKAAAAKKASIAFARASTALTLVAKLANEEAEAIKGIDTSGNQLDYVHSVATAGGAAYKQNTKGKAAWQAGDAAHKAEEHRISTAKGSDDACGKLKHAANSIAMWLGAAHTDFA